MGFLDLHAFNLTLLGKQAWKLITNPHTLLSWILKARYSLTCNPLQLEPKFGCSFVWRSILAGFLVLKGGLRWWVGNSLSTNAWQDNWLAQPYMSKPLPYNQYLARTCGWWVLFHGGCADGTSRCWNIFSTRGLFKLFVASLYANSLAQTCFVGILRTPENFAVASAYCMALEMQERIQGSHSPCTFRLLLVYFSLFSVLDNGR